MPSPSASLASSELFSPLGAVALEELAAAMVEVRLPGGTVLFHQGAAADCLFVVESGRLRVALEAKDGSERVLGEVGPGDTVGELSVLTGESRTATVRAVRDTTLLRLDADAFHRLVARHPSLMMRVSQRVGERYLSTIRGRRGRARTQPRTIALVPTSGDVPLSRFARQLEQAFRLVGSARRITSDVVNDALGADMAQVPPAHARGDTLAQWLAREEASHDVVIYEADLVRSQWSSRCLRQADRVLLVGVDSSAPDLGPIERAMRRDGAEHDAVQRELVILHGAKANVYPGTREWLAGRRVSRHHHVVVDSPKDVSRLVRMLTGTATALVLGGGGTRCFTQIGVLRALREAGVEVDMIGGTSMGAFVAAQHAFGLAPDEMEAFNIDLWARQRPLARYTLPFVGLTSPDTFVRATRKLYGDADIEDLGIPFFCCASNITKARLEVLDRGPAWFALGASLALPGFAPPACANGDMLVDGALLDNLPIGVMRGRCDGRVLAVDVTPAVDLRVDPMYTLCPSSWEILANRLNPFAPPLQLPGILEILSRCVSLGSLQRSEELRGQADLFMHPPIEGYGMFEWDRVRELSDVGHGYATPVLAEWVRTRERPEVDGERLFRITAPLALASFPSQPQP